MKEMKGHARKGRPSQRLKTLHCLVDAAGSLSCRVKEPFRVGFLLIQRPEWLHADIRRLKRELPPRGKSGEYHATEDDSRTKAMIRALLCLNPEPRMIIVEWRMKVFPESAFLKDKLKIFADTNQSGPEIHSGPEIPGSARDGKPRSFFLCFQEKKCQLNSICVPHVPICGAPHMLSVIRRRHSRETP
jgi:hypothetical protein